jgi:hypothetical protein
VVDMFEASAREKRSTFVKVVVGCLIAFIIAPPLAQAAVQAVRVRGAVKVKDTGGGVISASSIGNMGLFEAAGSTGAVDVRNFAGGGGVLGAADCAAATPIESSVSVTNAIVTGLILTGTDATFTATAQAFGNHALPLLNWTLTADNSGEFVGLGNGLTITTELKITCTAGTNGNLIVVGQ